MCGMMQSGVCRFSELTPGQFGLTKQLVQAVTVLKCSLQVLRLALPHVTLVFVSVLYAALGGWILTLIKYSDHSAYYTGVIERLISGISS